MKQINKITITLILACMVLLAFPSSASAQGPGNDKVVVGGNYTLPSGESLSGDLVIVGGTGTIEENARVNGNVFLTGGTLTIDGEVDGNVSAFGGSIYLGNTALVHGDVATVGAAIHRASRARVEGDFIEGSNRPFQFTTPGRVFLPNFRFDTHPIWSFLGFVARTLAIAALAILVGLIAPNLTSRTTSAIVVQPVLAGGLGLLTAILAPIVLLILAITILLIPVSLVGILVLIVAGLLGWIAVGLEVGRRIAGLFRQDWPLPISAGVGTLVMSLVVSGIGFIPCVGWIAPFLVSILGLGGVLLTRFGTRGYPPISGPIAPYPVTAPTVPPPYQPTNPPSSAPISYSEQTGTGSVPVTPESSSRVNVYPTPEASIDGDNLPPAPSEEL